MEANNTILPDLAWNSKYEDVLTEALDFYQYAACLFMSYDEHMELSQVITDIYAAFARAYIAKADE